MSVQDTSLSQQDAVVIADIPIGTRIIGRSHPTFVIAEVAQSHDGSVDKALEYIDAAAEAGADAIKFQTHLASFESTRDEPFRISMAGNDKSRYEYWQRMEFEQADWRMLANRAAKHGLIFLSSAFSVEAVSLLDEIGVPAWKVASGEFKSRELLDAMCATGRPLLLSTGMSTLSEIEVVAKFVQSRKVPLAIFQCTSQYPTGLKDIGLNLIQELGERFGVPIGLSDHSGSVHPALAAIGVGVDMLEIHLVLDKLDPVPDAPASLTPDEVKLVCDFRDAYLTMVTHPVDKDAMAEQLGDVRALFTKSVAPRHSLAAGTILARNMLVPRKPGTGIPFERLDDVLGRRLAKDVSPQHLLSWNDLDV